MARKRIGHVAVDSGQLFITDPAYLNNWRAGEYPVAPQGTVVGYRGQCWGVGDAPWQHAERHSVSTRATAGSRAARRWGRHAAHNRALRGKRTAAGRPNPVTTVPCGATEYPAGDDNSYHRVTSYMLDQTYGEVENGVVVSGWGGDGVFPVYVVEDEDGLVERVEIVFYDPEDEDDET